jgi:hypothetical protein
VLMQIALTLACYLRTTQVVIRDAPLRLIENSYEYVSSALLLLFGFVLLYAADTNAVACAHAVCCAGAGDASVIAHPTEFNA